MATHRGDREEMGKSASLSFMRGIVRPNMQWGMNLFSPLIANAFFAARWRMPAFTEGKMHVQCVALSA
jgi:hypothetical protein